MPLFVSKVESSNVIVVDWAEGAGGSLIDYAQAASNSILTGKAIAQFIQTNDLLPSSIYCIGHNLGAHVRFMT